MAVSRRARFEVLRRDEHTCQYCGCRAPDVQLQVDHVVPVALGGTDNPSNLVAACRDCNSGKTSIQPDSPLVKKVSAASAVYALTMVDKFTRIKARLESEDEYLGAFADVWSGWGIGSGEERTLVPLPLDHRNALRRWHSMGVPVELVTYAVDVAMRATTVETDNKFRYAAGVVWRTLEAEDATYPLTPETAKAFTEIEVDELTQDAFTRGWNSGYAQSGRQAAAADVVEHFVDRAHPDDRMHFYKIHKSREYGEELRADQARHLA